MQYTKNNVTVEAFKWDGSDQQQQDNGWFLDVLKVGMASISQNKTIHVKTPTGTVSVQVGDYLIKGRGFGRIIVCDCDKFENAYTPVT